MKIKKNLFNKLIGIFRFVLTGLVMVSFIGSTSVPTTAMAAAGLPDLVITEVTVTDATDNPITEVDAGQTIKVNITVDNIGGDEYEDCVGNPDPECVVDEVYRDVYIGTAPLAPTALDPQGCHPTGRWADAGQPILLADDPATTRTINVTFNNSDAGEIELYVYADVNCSVDEDGSLENEPAGAAETNNRFGPIPLTVNAVGCTPPTGGAPVFADVPANHWAREYIEAMYYCGYTAGCSNSPLSYCPSKGMSRVESAVFMLRGNFGSTYEPPAAPWDTFADNWSAGAWGEKWAEGLFQAGLTAGCGTNPLRFCPWDQTPRLQLAVFGTKLRRGDTYVPPAATGNVFADITDPSLWYAKWAEQAYADGLIPACGTQGGKPLFCPNSLVDRALAAYTVAKAKNLVP